MAITRLASLEPTTSAASFTSISSAYKALIIMGQTKSDDTSSTTTENSRIYMQFNSDTGSNYRKNFIFIDGNESGGINDGGSTTQTQCYWESANSYSGYLGWAGWYVLIPDYAIAGVSKAAQAEAATIGTTGLNIAAGVQGWSWSGTDAISTITFTNQYGNYVAGTNIVLYGLEV